MRYVIKTLIMLVLIPLISGYLVEFIHTIKMLTHLYREKWQFLIGALAGIILFPFIKKRRFIRTFEHEMTHLIFAKLFFAKVKVLNVSSEGEGYVEYTSGPNPFIGLSPYFFPLYSAIFTALIPLLNPAFSGYFFIATGFFLIIHLLSIIFEIASLQPDIRQEGIVFSAFFVTFFLIFFYGIIISEAISYEQILMFIKGGASRSLAYLIIAKDYALSSLKRL